MASKSLTITWKGNADDVIAKAALVEEVVAKTGGKVAAAPAGRNLFSVLSEAAQAFFPQASAVSGQVEGLTGKLGGLASSASGASSGIMGLSSGLMMGAAGAVALAGAVGALAAKGVGDMLALGTETLQVQRAMGGTTQQASGLVAVGKELGVTSDEIATAMGRAAANTAAHADKLREEGVQVARAKDGTVDMHASLLNLGDAYRATVDPATRADIARQVFGRGWQTMAPILAQSRDTLAELYADADKHHQILNPAEVQATLDFKIQMNDLHEAVSGVSMELGKHLIPFLTDLARGAVRVVDDIDSLGNKFHWLGSAFKFVGESLSPALTIIAKFGHDASDANGKAAKSALEAADAAKKEAAGFAEVDTSLSSLQSALLGTAQAHKAVDDAGSHLADAQDNLAAKQKALADLQRKAVVDEEAVSRARFALGTATTSVADAEANLADVRQKANDITNDAGDYAKQEADALDAVNQASLRVTDAQQNLADVQQKVNDITGRAGQYANDLAHAELAVEHATLGREGAAVALADAQRALAVAVAQGNHAEEVRQQEAIKQATLGIKDAQQSAGDAQANLTKLQNEATPGTKEYDAVQRELRDAVNQVDQAERSARDSQDRLNTVRNEAIPGTREYAAVQRDLRVAQDQVTSAQQSAKTAAENLATALQGDTSRSDELAAAKRGVRDAEHELADARSAGALSALAAKDADDKRSQSLLDNADAIGLVRSQMEQLQAEFPQFDFGGVIGQLPGGGGVGRPSFAQDQANKVAYMGGASAPVSNVTVHVNAGVVAGPQDVRQIVVDAVQQHLRQGGNLTRFGTN